MYQMQYKLRQPNDRDIATHHILIPDKRKKRKINGSQVIVWTHNPYSYSFYLKGWGIGKKLWGPIMEMNSSFKQDCINLYYGNAEMEHYKTIQRETNIKCLQQK